MIINSKRTEKELTVIPQGRLDSVTSPDLHNFLEDNFRDDDEILIIDFQNVDFISSKGLRVIVAQYKELNGRKMRITGANASVREVFRISGLLKIFDAK